MTDVTLTPMQRAAGGLTTSLPVFADPDNDATIDSQSVPDTAALARMDATATAVLAATISNAKLYFDIVVACEESGKPFEEVLSDYAYNHAMTLEERRTKHMTLPEQDDD